MKIRFWGTRGSIAKPGIQTLRYGGNTSCVEIRSDANDLLILDAGTGLHGLGMALMNEGLPRTSSMFISHTHYDHIQGLPFFAPFYNSGYHWNIFGPMGYQGHLKKALEGQMDEVYFPITAQIFQAKMDYHGLKEGTMEIGDIKIHTQYLNHPGVTMGYRIEVDGHVIVYCTDHEPHSQAMAYGGKLVKGSEDERHAHFLANSDIVIHDTQYTADEYENKKGWGHSTVEYVVDLAHQASVKHLFLYHHDPNRTDDQIDGILAMARNRSCGNWAKPMISVATEGNEILLPRSRFYAPQFLAPRPSDLMPNLGDAAYCSSSEEKDLLLLAPSYPILIEASEKANQHPISCKDIDELCQKITETEARIIFIEAASFADYQQKYQQKLDQVLSENNYLVLISPIEPTKEELEASSITHQLHPPFSRIYATCRILTWTNQTQASWNRAPIPEEEELRLQYVAKCKEKLQEPAIQSQINTYINIAHTLVSGGKKEQHITVGLHLIFEDTQEALLSSDEELLEDLHRDVAFCSFVVGKKTNIYSPDTTKDDRFQYNPLVLESPHLRTYFGSKLDIEGKIIGALCCYSSTHFELTQEQQDAFARIADFVSSILTPQEVLGIPAK